MARLSVLLMLLANGTRPPIMSTHTPIEQSQPYHYRGALWYVASVMSVYAMAILFMIVSHINRRSVKRELDREVAAFLRSAPTVRIEEERQRRQNLKRAMQPFIRLALDRRTIGVQASVADDSTSGELLDQPSIETLTDNTVIHLAATNRVLATRRRLRHASRASATSSVATTTTVESSCWHGGGSYEDIVVLLDGVSGNDKSVQCVLDARQTLSHHRARGPLLPVLSETELGASATSYSMMVMMQRQQLHQQKLQHQQQRLQSTAAYQTTAVNESELLQVSASRTHVPRFLAF